MKQTLRSPLLTSSQGVLRDHIAEWPTEKLTDTGTNDTGEIAEANLRQVKVEAALAAKIERKARGVSDFGHVCDTKPERRKNNGGISKHLVWLAEGLAPRLFLGNHRLAKPHARDERGLLLVGRLGFSAGFLVSCIDGFGH